MKVLRILTIATLLFGFSYVSLQAQCVNWNGNPNKEQAENAHVLYRGVIKGKSVEELQKLPDSEFQLLFENWKTAYDIAPAADGKRPSHYTDGRKIYKVLVAKAADDAKKKEYNDMIVKLYDQQMECYKNEAYLSGRKAFDMFYMPNYGYSTETFNTFKTALDKGQNSTEYIIFEPLAQLMVYLYESKKVSQQETQQLYGKMEEIADHNIENNQRYKEYYKSAKARMSSHFSKIEDEVFDCDYFKKKLVPQYREHPDDLEVIKYVFNKLRMQGCDTTEAVMAELKEKYQSLATEINAQLELERRQNNPGYDAVQLQKEGKYEEAVKRYQEAAEQEEDPSNKAQFIYSMAFIQTWQFNQLSSARSNAQDAAKLRSGWGKPFILLGDIYAKMSTRCGDDWNKRMAILAAIDKYAYAKSIDGDVASDANKRIGQYSGSRPEKQDGFMRGIKEGQSVQVGCGIGETVRVRFK